SKKSPTRKKSSASGKRRFAAAYCAMTGVSGGFVLTASSRGVRWGDGILERLSGSALLRPAILSLWRACSAETLLDGFRTRLRAFPPALPASLRSRGARD